MKKIQTVFEDEKNIEMATKKNLEDMNAEEKSIFFAKKKQKIIGSKRIV